MSDVTIGVGTTMAMYSLGIVLDKEDIVDEQRVYWISVPKSSYVADGEGNELAGKVLAQRFRHILESHGIDNFVVKLKIRDEHWTKEKDDEAVKYIANLVYGDQDEI